VARSQSDTRAPQPNGTPSSDTSIELHWYSGQTADGQPELVARVTVPLDGRRAKAALQWHGDRRAFRYATLPVPPVIDADLEAKLCEACERVIRELAQDGEE
jgi:hypothetical protein